MGVNPARKEGSHEKELGGGGAVKAPIVRLEAR